MGNEWNWKNGGGKAQLNTLQSSLALGPKALGIFPKSQKLAKKTYLGMVNALFLKLYITTVH